MKRLLVAAVTVLFLAPSVIAQQKATIEERLTRLEEGQKALKEEVANLRSEMNARFVELRSDMNARFASMDARFDDMKAKFGWLYILLSAIIALNGAIVGSVVWLARQERPIGQRHYEQILRREDEIEREILSLRQRLDNLEKTIQPS